MSLIGVYEFIDDTLRAALPAHQQADTGKLVPLCYKFGGLDTRDEDWQVTDREADCPTCSTVKELPTLWPKEDT